MTREDVAGKVVLLLKKEFKGKMNNWRTRGLVTGFSFCARKVLVLFLKKDEKKKKKKGVLQGIYIKCAVAIEASEKLLLEMGKITECFHVIGTNRSEEHL